MIYVVSTNNLISKEFKFISVEESLDIMKD